MWESNRERDRERNRSTVVVCMYEFVRIMTINQMFNDFVSATAAATAFVNRYVIILIIAFLLRLGPGTHIFTPGYGFPLQKNR